MTIKDYYEAATWRPPVTPPPPSTAARELAQLREDIRLMNEIGNRQASRHGFCDAWEAIMRHINKRTNNRLGLFGRPGYSGDYEITDDE